MTDLTAFLAEITALRGISGDQMPVAKRIAEAFEPLCDEVYIDAMQNVIARIGDKGPKVLITAHLDEIGLVATTIEDDGAIRFGRVGGVDPRILPGSRVTVHTEEGAKLGVVGAMPPHLLTPADRKKNYEMDKLFVDIGEKADRVHELVHPGTPITLYGPLKALKNKRFAGKTIDDRGGVAMMLRAAELLQKTQIEAQVFFVSAVQEEVGSYGAMTSTYAIDPDIGIAIDVTHGTMPDCDPDEIYPLEKVVLTEGPNIHPTLHKHLMELAGRIKVDVQTSICPHVTWTDASEVQVNHQGVPTALIEMPLKYMHTTVETMDAQTFEEAARLLAAFVAGLDAGWEDLLCF
ncbi:MAG: M20/M25/M40 family metallo-hydrolase [Oscillospiraceae bacterium]|nr:M20/M25/M40 family metallo-hydrolase [Oscillospiraceae bacterium]